MLEYIKSLALQALDYIKKFTAENAVNLLLSAIGSLIFIYVGFKLTNMLVKRIKKSKWFQRLEDGIESFLSSFINIALKVFVVYISATILGVDATALSAAFGSIGLAIGLALQGSLSNFAGGMMILTFHPFSLGDFIESGVNIGTVTEIGVFYTTIITPDNKTRIIPNGQLSNTPVTNYSREKKRRMDIEFTTVATADVDLVVGELLAVSHANERVLKDPAPFASLSKHLPAALTFTLQIWVNTEDYNEVQFEIQSEVKKAFASIGL